MSRTFVCTAFLCSVLFSCCPALAGSMPVIRGQVYDMTSQQALPGTQVRLYVDNGDATFSDADTPLGMATTDENGEYEFGDLDPNASYFVINGVESSDLLFPGQVSRLIDSFDVTQSVMADPISGARMGSAIGPEASVLGGYRDLYLEILSGSAEGKLRVNPYSLNSNLQIDMAAGVVGRATVTWDGVQGATGAIPEGELDMDFTGGGIYTGISMRLAVDAAGAGQEVDLVIHSTDGGVSTAAVEFPVIRSVVPSHVEFVAFDDFVGDADVTSVSAFQLIIDSTSPSLDAQIDVVGLSGPKTVDFAVIPEPTAGLLLLGGMIMLFGYRGRRSSSSASGR